MCASTALAGMTNGHTDTNRLLIFLAGLLLGAALALLLTQHAMVLP